MYSSTTKKRVISEAEYIPQPLFYTVESMAKTSGIGENTLRVLIDEGKIDHLRIGNKRLLTTDAILDWYERAKVSASV